MSVSSVDVSIFCFNHIETAVSWMAAVKIATSIERLLSLRTSRSAICHHRSAIYKARGPETSGSKEMK